jgi:hypothetical protein
MAFADAVYEAHADRSRPALPVLVLRRVATICALTALSVYPEHLSNHVAA